MARARAARLPALALMVLAAGCGSPAGSATSPPTSAAVVSPEPSQAPGSLGQQSAAPLEGQIDSAFGLIWNSMPRTFPAPAGSVAVEVNEPVSAAFDVGPAGGGVADIARFYADILVAAGYTVSVDGPLQDGSYVVDAPRGNTPCRVQARAVQVGTVNRLTIFYGAGCPKP